MKKRLLDDSYWFVLQKRLLDSGFITVTMSAERGKSYWRPTPRGIKAYKTVCDLTKRNKLFKGPKYSDDELERFKNSEASSYETMRKWLVKTCMVKPIFDIKNDYERYELTEYAYEFFQTYTTSITKGSVNPEPSRLGRMAKASFLAIVLLCYTLIQVLISLHNRGKQKNYNKRR
jgi:hypothetical protein